jgi:hypothetical protein
MRTRWKWSVSAHRTAWARREEFVGRYGTTFTMLWDESFQSWLQLGVTSQPTAVLFTPDGTIITGWIGGIPEEQVLELVAQYAAG